MRKFVQNSVIVKNVRETLQDQPTAVKVVTYLVLLAIVLACIALITGLLAGATAAVFLSVPLASRKSLFGWLQELEKLNEQAFIYAVANTMIYCKKEGICTKEHGGADYDNGADALKAAFSWDDTDQGGLYWFRWALRLDGFSEDEVYDIVPESFKDDGSNKAIKGTRAWYFNQMPEPYRAQAFENTRQYWAADGYDAEEIETVLRRPCTGIEHALKGAFTFRNTDQGHLYWDRAANGIFDTPEDTAEPTRAKIERMLWLALFILVLFGFFYMIGHTVELVLSLAAAPLVTRSRMQKLTDVEKLAKAFEAHGPEGCKEFKTRLIEKGGPDYAHRTINDLPDHLRAEIFKLKI